MRRARSGASEWCVRFVHTSRAAPSTLMLRGIQKSRFPPAAPGMAERSTRSFQIGRSIWVSVVRMLPPVVAILLGLAVLAGLDGILIQTITPLQALAWGIL